MNELFCFQSLMHGTPCPILCVLPRDCLTIHAFLLYRQHNYILLNFTKSTSSRLLIFHSCFRHRSRHPRLHGNGIFVIMNTFQNKLTLLLTLFIDAGTFGVWRIKTQCGNQRACSDHAWSCSFHCFRDPPHQKHATASPWPENIHTANAQTLRVYLHSRVHAFDSHHWRKRMKWTFEPRCCQFGWGVRKTFVSSNAAYG